MRNLGKNQRQEQGRLLKHDTSVTLSNPKLVFKTLLECLEAGDGESACDVLAASLRHLNKSQLEKRYRIPRRTVYNLLSKKSAPSLALVAKVCHAIQSESSHRKRQKDLSGA